MTMNSELNDTFLTSAQAAQFLNISISTLKKLIEKGTIRSFKTPGGHHRIYKKALVESIFKNN